ncbi:MAG: hypothetical protein O7C75_05135 [Verrucomicrobia bacterium]|nr:hypothetical protein [Verrucomicrobiota bacterium]
MEYRLTKMINSLTIRFRFFQLCLFTSFAWMSALSAQTDNPRLEVKGDQIQLDGRAIKIIGLRCSNALKSEASTDDLIAALDLYQSYGVNTVTVFMMGSRFGNVKGYLADSSMNPVYEGRLERILTATQQRGMVTIVGCLYWSTSTAKEDLAEWSQEDADKAIANTARWLAEKEFHHVILDPDNEGMASRSEKWSAESFIRAAKAANPDLVVANNTRQDPPNEDLNMHFGKPEKGKPWFDSEATPKNAPGRYWSRFSKESHQQDATFYNYSRIGRYTTEMKADQLEQTRDGMENFNGHVLASTWLQCVPNEGVLGPFTRPGGLSRLGLNDDSGGIWNQDIDLIHPDAGILWWLEYVRDNY